MLRSFNILRNLQIQIKSGYIKRAPLEYYLMRRTPPMARDATPALFDVRQNIEGTDFPYLKYYHNAVRRNPQYGEESVFPMYFHQEPQALTLARKQYELIKAGMEEEAAYQKAREYVDSLEAQAYAELKSNVAVVEKLGSVDTIFSDPNMAASFSKWKKLLALVPYEKMSPADSADLDFFIQSDILKWSEIERERRMKDPMFFIQFEKLRALIFPEIAQVSESVKPESKKDVIKKLQDSLNIRMDRVKPLAPFYVEDYVFFLNKARDQPLLTRWSERERELLSRWILDTLAIRFFLENNPTAKIQSYLDDLRAFFFPMVRYPASAKEFNVPTAAQIKELLYENDIGYKQQSDKIYVRRFYLIPKILFPSETFATSILNDEEKVKNLLKDPTILEEEMKNAGFARGDARVVESKLREFHKRSSSAMAASSGSSIDFSSLEALLYGDTKKTEQPSSNETSQAKTSAKVEQDVETQCPVTLPPEYADKDEYTKDKYLLTNVGGVNTVAGLPFLRAQLGKMYEEKEEARRARRFQSLEELPTPDLLDNIDE